MIFSVFAAATITLHGGRLWNEVNGPGTPTVEVAGQAGSSLTVPGSRTLQEMTVRVGESRWRFLTDLIDGHRYSIAADPCCFFTDDDDDGKLRPTKRVVCSREGHCPEGLAGVSRFVLRDQRCADGESLCVTPAQLRTRADGLAVAIGDDDDFQPLGAAYRGIRLQNRQGPDRLRIRRGSRILFDGQVQFRLMERYTLSFDKAGNLQITID